MRFTPIIAVFFRLLYDIPATACHRFSVCKYPTPQRCSVAKVDRSWYVEIGMPTDDARTSEQIKDQQEHDEAVGQHKDELNDLLRLLHPLVQEDK